MKTLPKRGWGKDARAWRIEHFGPEPEYPTGEPNDDPRYLEKLNRWMDWCWCVKPEDRQNEGEADKR